MSLLNTTSSIEQLKHTSRLVEPKDKVPKLLHKLLSIPTPHGHEKNLHSLLPSKEDAVLDGFGNYIVTIGKGSRTVFSCHMDTMHQAHLAGSTIDLMITDGYKKADKNGMIYGCRIENGKIIPSILGADDKIGMWLCSEMIKAGVPGRYIFHAGEEKGCLGANWIAENTPWRLTGYDRAIALDRMHYEDIIHTQFPGRLVSPEFEKAMEQALNTQLNKMGLNGMRFKGSTGMLTDTAKYKSLIPECTNLSVGYFNQHTTSEHFDLIWVRDMLLPMLKKVDWEALPTKRDPKAIVAYSAYTPPKTWGNSQPPAFMNNGSSKPVDKTHKVRWSPVADGLPRGSAEDQKDAVLDWLSLSKDETVYNGVMYLLYDIERKNAQIREQTSRINELQQEVFALRADLGREKVKNEQPPFQPDIKGLDEDPNSMGYGAKTSEDILSEEDEALAEAINQDLGMQAKWLDSIAEDDDAKDIRTMCGLLDKVDNLMATVIMPCADMIKEKVHTDAVASVKRVDAILENVLRNQQDKRRLNRYIARCATELVYLAGGCVSVFTPAQIKQIEEVITELNMYALAHISEKGFEAIAKKYETLKETVH